MKIHHPLKSLIGPLAVAALALPAISQAQPFNPVPLKQSSYTFSIVVPQSAVAPVPACVNAFVGSGQTLSDNTFYEQGLYTPIPGDTYYNSGVPFHNTVFANINNANMTFLMPPTYLTNNDLMIVNGQYGYLPTGALTFNTPTTATSLEVLDSGGNGGCTVGWTVTYQNGNTQSGTLSVPDWFNGGSSVAWGCNGREDENGDLNNLNGSTQNNQVPYLYSTLISGLSSSSPVASVTFNYSSGSGVDNFFAVSASTDGTHYTPVPVSGFNVMALIPNTTPYPVTATMDNGTNLSNPGNTWFESGYYAADSSYGLPPSGSTFTSFSQPSHTYQMGNYSTNDATLIDADHLSANITPATPGAYTALAFLTAGGNIGGGNVMTNICIIQHADGVNETNLFFGYDWFNQSLPNAIAWESNGRVDMNSRSLNSIGNQGLPFLFETYFVLSDAGSAVTNIEVQYDTAPAGNSTTFIMAVSAATGAVLPIITQEPTPATQTWFVGQTATISVEVSGIAPLTNTWLAESNGIYVPLANGTDVNGSVVSGATTPTLSISDLTLLDSTNYEYIASNAGGTEPATTTASITVRSAGTAGLVPIANWNNIANETYPLGSTINIFSGGGPSQALATLTLSGGQVHNGWSSDGGTNGNGGNTSLMNGLLDAGNYGGSPAIATIGGLDNSTTYNVYIYDFSDTSRPSDGTDGLPDYTVNGTIYYMPVLGALTPSYWNEQDVAVGGTNFAGTGFVEGTPQATNDIGTFSYNTVSASSFGDYLEIPNVSPVNGAITIEPEADGTTYRSPFNGFELVPATGPSFGIHFLGNTADPVAIAPLPPVIQYETPSGLVNVPTNHAARMPLSVTVDEGSTAPLAYQWYGIVSGTTQAVAGATSANLTIVTTNTEAYYCVVTNFVGAATSAPVTINVFTPATPSPYVAELLALHPVAYWPLNETNGTVAFDYAGTNNGTYEGSYQLGEPGLPYANGVGTNTSAYFNGSSGYVDIPSGGANWNLNITGPMTAVEWVEVPAGGEPNFGCSLGHSDQSYRFVVNGTGNQPRWDDSGPDAYNGSFGITSQAWHQLVGIYDGSHEYLYVDNNLIDTESESSPPGGSLDDLNIAQAPDYAGSRNFEGNLAQVAIYNYALSVSQLQSLYASLDTAPLVSVTPATAAVASGNSVTFTASLAGTPATSLQWYVVVGTATNSIEGATNSMYTVTAPPLSDNGNIYAIMAANAYGTNFASATLTVTSAPAAFSPGLNIGPTNAAAYAGAPVTFVAPAQGSLPISYQWSVDGMAVSGATNASFTMPAGCGTSEIQVAFSNAYSGGIQVTSTVATLQVTNAPATITFNTNGVGWQLNGNPGATVPTFTGSNVVELTDNTGGEDSSLFYSTAQYVGSFTASFIYQAGGNEAADGTAFILQNSTNGVTALGGGGGELGYAGDNNSAALEINLYDPDGGVGIAFGTNGNSHSTGASGYALTGKISVASGDPIQFVVNYANGVYSVNMEDLYSFDTFETNYAVGSLTSVIGSDLAYVGFSGADGGASSTQTITDFEFTPVVPGVALTVSPASDGSVMISWPAANPDYVLQTTTSLLGTWSAGPTPTESNGTNYVNVSSSGGGEKFYRLLLECQ